MLMKPHKQEEIHVECMISRTMQGVRNSSELCYSSDTMSISSAECTFLLYGFYSLATISSSHLLPCYFPARILYLTAALCGGTQSTVEHKKR
ncbi:hypothetical protein OPV22_029481 [Ensete ventricosum]|uniref:Uncharacterized protein n=1 Tax=Ensete ventricosum TaxID=4639 RepID=A0AAV8QDQ1_ENSVE|nr:hypothetical protein OPV22_029481 [Ensete ventricosum]